MKRIARSIIKLMSPAIVADDDVSSVGVNQANPENIFRQENLVAWCIVPYDKLNRTPKQRIALLKELNFTQYAYDWRPEHLPSIAEELHLAAEENVRIAAVWMWIDDGYDAVGKLSANNQRLLDIVKASGQKTKLWLGINGNVFDGLDEVGKVRRGVEMVRYLRHHVPANVTEIGLYGHGDWFGEPENQIGILETLNDPTLGLVYNFHHAHGQIKSFSALMQRMMPWLWTVNLNGMDSAGNKILPIGSGEDDLAMLKILKQSGFSGSVGILGHIEEEDVKLVLQRNLAGLRMLEANL